MIGLEYICNLYNVKFAQLADELGISRQVINSWIKGRRKITKKYIPILAEKFKVEQLYFQKELSELDKLEIQKNKISNEENKLKQINKNKIE
jgi:transcriptional regulator with XRE-family HTH domain